MMSRLFQDHNRLRNVFIAVVAFPASAMLQRVRSSRRLLRAVKHVKSRTLVSLPPSKKFLYLILELRFENARSFLSPFLSYFLRWLTGFSQRSHSRWFYVPVRWGKTRGKQSFRPMFHTERIILYVNEVGSSLDAFLSTSYLPWYGYYERIWFEPLLRKVYFECLLLCLAQVVNNYCPDKLSWCWFIFLRYCSCGHGQRQWWCLL